MKMDSFVSLGEELHRKRKKKKKAEIRLINICHAARKQSSLTDCHMLGCFPDSRFPSITVQRNN